MQVGTYPPTVHHRCFATDGVVGATLPLPQSCRVVAPDSAFGRQVERCVTAPLIWLTIDLGSYRPLGSLQASWPTKGQAAAVELSTDGVRWEGWSSLRPGEKERVGGPPIWARWVRLRARYDHLFDYRQPSREREVDRDTGLVDSPPRPPRHQPVPAAEVRRWPGTLAGLEELVVLPPPPRRDRPWEFPPLTWRRGVALVSVGLLLAFLLTWRAERQGPKQAAPTWYSRPGSARVDARGTPPEGQRAVALRRALDRMSLTASVAALITPLASLVLLPVILFPWVGLVLFLFLGAQLGKAGVALAAIAAPLLVVAAAGGQGREWRRGAVLTSVGVAVSSLLVLGGSWLDQEGAVDADDARAMARPLAAVAEPVDVVRAALRWGESDSAADRARACGLLVAEARDDCRPQDIDRHTQQPSLVSIHGNRAVVYYGHDLDGALAVRLVRSPRGWELLELPTSSGPGDCVADEVDSGGDPFRCDR